ncbi:MAG: GIY-YIG nuclease family protein [Sphingobacteriaceae bacterium]|nr:MAG: GIY-YIG nuclease family protein [Sphingobacteriaceae bacterium]
MAINGSLDDIFNDDPFGLLDIKPAATSARNADERLVASFEDINAFYDANKREPSSAGGIQEYQLLARLKGIRLDIQKVEMLLPYDRNNLLKSIAKPIESINDIFEDDSFGLLETPEDSIFDLKHVTKETTMPDYIGSRKPCLDFEKFEHLFIDCQLDLREGKRKLYPFKNEQQINKGYFFVLKGILLYVDDVSERERINGKVNARLRCIFENGTESDMLLRSLAAELYKNGRRVTEKDEKLLDNFNNITDDDQEMGYIYVLKSLSNNPEIKSIQHLFKIGFSKQPVEDRIKNASQEPTYLMAPVSIVTNFKCYNMNPQKLELLMHNFFGESCLEIDVHDSKGKRFTPREWFIAPIEIITQAINLIVSGEIVNYKYDSYKNEIVFRY